MSNQTDEIVSILEFIKNNTIKDSSYYEVAQSMLKFYEEKKFISVEQVKYIDKIVDYITTKKQSIKSMNDKISNFKIKESKNSKSQRSKHLNDQSEIH